MRSGVQLRDLEAFLVLAEELHFGRTAERLGLTHSRVSQVVQTLKARVGGRLFDRTSRRVLLTPLGRQLRDQVAPPYRALDQAVEHTRQTARGIVGVLGIGLYSPVLGGPHLVEITRRFQQSHPECEVRFHDVGLDSIYGPLRRGDVDMLVTRLPVADDDLVVGPELATQRRVVAVARDHPLARFASVHAEQVAGLRNGIPPGLPAAVMDSFVPKRTESGRPWHRVPIHSFSEAVMRVALGEIVHPTVQPWVEHHRHPDVVAVPIEDLVPSRTALVWLRGSRSLKIAAFCRSASEILSPTRPIPADDA